MSAPLIEFLLRFRERERANAVQGASHALDPIVTQSFARRLTVPTAEARSTSPNDPSVRR